jgi:hypothetical protein
VLSQGLGEGQLLVSGGRQLELGRLVPNLQHQKSLLEARPETSARDSVIRAAQMQGADEHRSARIA